MERVEFFVGSDGKVWMRQHGSCEELTPQMMEIVEKLYDYIRRLFPTALKSLLEIFEKSRPNKRYMMYLVVERFLRCNMGNDDETSYDVDGMTVHLEKVSCPLRGICKLENIVCMPRMKTIFTDAEMSVAILYATGMTVSEIAGRLRKSESTVNNQLWTIKKRLGLKSRRGVARLVMTYNLL